MKNLLKLQCFVKNCNVLLKTAKIAGVIVGAGACSDPEFQSDNNPPVFNSGELEITSPTATPVNVGGEGGPTPVFLKSDNGWIAATDVAWLTLAPASGAGGREDTIVVTAAPLAAGEERKAYVTIKSGSNVQTLTFVQTGSAPAPAKIAGRAFNEYPDSAVTLTADIKGAVRYVWFRDGASIDTTLFKNTLVVGPAIAGDEEEHAYSVRGLNVLGEGAESTPLNVKITRLENIPLIYPASVSVAARVPCRDTALTYKPANIRLVRGQVLLKASEVKGALKYEWYSSASETPIYTLDITGVTQDSAFYSKLDSLLTYLPATSGDYSVKVYNNATPTPLTSSRVGVSVGCVLNWNDSINLLTGNYTATAAITQWDSDLRVGDAVASPPASYTLKVTKKDSTTLRIVTDFGVLGDTAVFEAKVDFETSSISIAAQRLAPANSRGGFPAAYSPCWIARYRYLDPLFSQNAGQALSASIGRENGALTIELDFAYLLYRSRAAANSEYVGHPESRKPIAIGTGVVWTKQ